MDGQILSTKCFKLNKRTVIVFGQHYCGFSNWTTVHSIERGQLFQLSGHCGQNSSENER